MSKSGGAERGDQVAVLLLQNAPHRLDQLGVGPERRAGVVWRMRVVLQGELDRLGDPAAHHTLPHPTGSLRGSV
jgi:hypothetical protein